MSRPAPASEAHPRPLAPAHGPRRPSGRHACLRVALAAAALLLAPAAAAQDHRALAARALDAHVLPGWAAVAEAGDALAGAARARCAGEAGRAPLVAAYHDAFDAWARVSHLRLGPTEAAGRGLALAFWPDPKGFAAKALSRLLASDDPVIEDPAAYAEVSVAARGLLALDLLLFDPRAPDTGSGRPCALAAAIAGDFALTAAAIRDGWRETWGPALRTAGVPGNALFPAPEDAARALLTALATGLEHAAARRLGEPLGSVGRPRPRLAEGWRSGRPLRTLRLALAGMQDLAEALAPALPPEDAADLRAAFDRAREVAARAPEPLTEAVADPARRIAVEAVVTEIETVRRLVAQRLAPALGVTIGFNALDGD